jgi:hypothetical protein
MKCAAAVPLINAALGGIDPSKLEMPSLVYTPTEPLDLATMGAFGVGAPWLFGKAMGSPVSLGRAATYGFGPVVLPLTAVGDVANMFLGPMADPRYQLGMRGYFESLGHGVKKNIEQVSEAAREARRRYGAMGIPVQMAHGIMNPVTSAMYLGRSLKDWMLGPSGAESALRAEGAVDRALGRM